jgi:hypothetical protein
MIWVKTFEKKCVQAMNLLSTEFYTKCDQINHADALTIVSSIDGHSGIICLFQYPDDCCPQSCAAKCLWMDAFSQTLLGKIWGRWRFYMFKLVENSYFETFIIIMILASSLALVRTINYQNEANCFIFKLLIHCSL